MNIYEFPQLPLAEELLTTLLENETVRIERIVSTGQVSSWYDQKETEFVILLEGQAKLLYENGDTLSLCKGDTVLIRPHQRHKVVYTSKEPPCLWLCLFF